MDSNLDRRSFLSKVGRLAGTGLFSFIPLVGLSKKSMKFPFTLGIASGDPLSDSVMLWTRLVPDPLQTEELSFGPVEVKWQISKDQSFSNIVKEGETIAEPKFAHSVHVEVNELEPACWYFYRFEVGNERSPIGRTKTAPEPGASVDHLNFAFASCQKYPDGYYTAYDHMLKENIELLFFLGDYIYEGAEKGNIGRAHIPQKELHSLSDYRLRYEQYKSDPSLQAAHAAFPWIVVFDDHEFKNDWGGKELSENSQVRRRNAFQAYYEHMPLRKSAIPEKIDMQLYRKFTYGDLVEFNVLDTRQYRSKLACGTSGRIAGCEERYKSSRTMLGWEQEDWLFEDLKSSSAHWNILPQQVMMGQWDWKSGAGEVFNMDKWDGYVATRNRLFNTVKEDGSINLVVLSADYHLNTVSDLKQNFNSSDSSILGTEFMTTSISSGGNGQDISQMGINALAENSNMKFFNGQRGYVRCQLTREQSRADFRVLPYVNKPGSRIKTRASFIVKHGQPGAIQI